MVTVYVQYKPSLISDNWLADIQDLEAVLKKIMPEVKMYGTRGFKPYKWYSVQDVCSCFNYDNPEEAEGIVIELNVIPKNL